MARYTGTRGRDEFIGISGQDNRFLFRPGYLDGADIVSGSSELTDIDTLVLYRPDGATGSLNVQAGKFDQVRNIEVVELADPGIVLTVSQQLAGSSQRGFLTINGSSGNDVVSGQPTDPSRGPVTTALVFNANGGADSFTGGEGDDRVRFADETRTGTTLDGRGGNDTLVYTGVGTFDFATLADVRQFEGVELRASDGSSTLILDDKPFATSGSGVFTVRSYGSDTIDASRVSAGNTVIAFLGDGADTYIGGPSSANIDAGRGEDTVTLVNGGGQASGGEGLDVANLGLALASPYFGGIVQLKLTDLATRTFDVSFQGGGFAPLAEVGHAVIDGFETLNFTADTSYRPFNFDFATYEFDFSNLGTGLTFESVLDNNLVRYSISADQNFIVGGVYTQGNYDKYRSLDIIATSFADTINGYNGYISGLGGDDIIIGGAGDNYIDGGAGVNSLNGGGGYDGVVITAESIAELNSGVDISINIILDNHYQYNLANNGIIYTDSSAIDFESISAMGTQYDDIINIDFDYEYILPFYRSPAYAYGQDGDDKFIIPYFQITSLDGGAGSDTAIISSENSVITLTNISYVQNEIERIDLGANHGNTLRINEQNVISLSSERDALFTAAPVDDALVVDGDATDTLDLHSTVTGGLWIEEANGVGLDGSAGGDYRFLAYQLNGVTTAYIAVDSDVTVTTGGNAAADAFVSALQAQEAAKNDVPLELTQDLLLPAFFDVDEPVAPYSPIHGDLAQPLIA